MLCPAASIATCPKKGLDNLKVSLNRQSAVLVKDWFTYTSGTKARGKVMIT